MQCQMCTKTDYNSLKAKKNKKKHRNYICTSLVVLWRSFISETNVDNFTTLHETRINLHCVKLSLWGVLRQLVLYSLYTKLYTEHTRTWHGEHKFQMSISLRQALQLYASVAPRRAPFSLLGKCLSSTKLRDFFSVI